jgi:virginiamycin B lyase
VFFASLAGNYLGQIDPEADTVTVLEPPVPRQGARRVWSDSRGALWNSGDLFRYDSGANGYYSEPFSSVQSQSDDSSAP